MRKIRLHWSAHPFKDYEWYKRQCQEMSPDAVAAELDIVYAFSKSTRVFPEFEIKTHVKRDMFKFDPYFPIYRIWDFGKITNCVLYMQQDEYYNKTFLMERLLKLDKAQGSATQTQITTTLQDSATYFPGCKFIDICDPAGANRHHDAPSSSIEQLNAVGIFPRYHNILAASTRDRKLNAIDSFQTDLCRMNKNGPIINIYCTDDKKLGCPTLIEALAGGYCYKKDHKGNLLDIVHEVHPYEDIMDCVFYFYIENGIHNIRANAALQTMYKEAYSTQNNILGDYF